jgi:hypothetical protein
VANCGIHAVVNAFYVNAKKAIEICFGGRLDGPDMGDAGIVHENVQAFLARELVEDFLGARLVGNVACIGLRIAAGCGNFVGGGITRFFIKVQNADGRALLKEALRDGAADSAASASNDGDFAIEAERIAMFAGRAQRETPRFQGMKSFCASNSALV